MVGLARTFVGDVVDAVGCECVTACAFIGTGLARLAVYVAELAGIVNIQVVV
jgi:hypothetical protein